MDSEHKAKKGGIVQFERITVVTNDQGQQIALARGPARSSSSAARTGRWSSGTRSRTGPSCSSTTARRSPPGTSLCKWDPHSIPIIAEEGGTVRFEDIKEGETLRKEKDAASGIERFTIMEHKGDLHPQIVHRGRPRATSSRRYFIPERANLEVTERRRRCRPGTLLAKTPREVSQTQDITGGLPRVTEIFEARRPRDPAVMAEVAGKVRLGDKKRGKRHHLDPAGGRGRQADRRGAGAPGAGRHAAPRVHAGEYVKAGDPLVYGPLVPHDILRITGTEAVQDYLVREVQSVYRTQRVDIDDKHIEIIVAQMLRKVKVEDDGRHRPAARAR